MEENILYEVPILQVKLLALMAWVDGTFDEKESDLKDILRKLKIQ